MVRGLDLKRQLANFGHRAAHRENLHHPATKERFGPCKGVESYCTNPPRVHGDGSSRCNQHSRESDHCKLLLVIWKKTWTMGHVHHCKPMLLNPLHRLQSSWMATWVPSMKPCGCIWATRRSDFGVSLPNNTPTTCAYAFMLWTAGLLRMSAMFSWFP